MTLPLPRGGTATSLPVESPAPALPQVQTPPAVEFPLGWILDHAAPPVQYRSATEVARLPLRDPQGFGALPYAHPPAIWLALGQRLDGGWSGGMLAIPSARAGHFEGVGTIPAVQRLLEYGWEQASPPLMTARRTLFRLLAEDEDPAYLFELAPKSRPEPELVRRGRGILREAAAAALAQAGYENDPRLRGAARRILARLDAFLRSPLAQKPFVRSGNQHVLAPGIHPPSIHALAMLGHMPLFLRENNDTMDRLYDYLSQAQPRATPATMIGKKMVPEPQLLLGDPLPTRNAADADIPMALTWLELLARLGFLRRNDGWTRLLDRFLDDRDRDGVWRPSRSAALRSSNPFAWPRFPLEPATNADERWSDLTFRLGLIARLAGRAVELI